MREILFRAKTVKNVHWIWGDLFHAGTEPSDGEFAISYWDDEDGWMNENVQPATIGQFTGLLDKNGKRIFEGDIVECVSWNEYFSKDGKHGWIIGANGTIQLQVAGKCYVNIKNCQYSAQQTVTVKSAGVKEIAKFDLPVATDGETTTIKYDGSETTLTFTFPAGSAYIHGIEVYNVEQILFLFQEMFKFFYKE